MDEIINIYKIGQFNIKKIHYSQEFKFILHDFANKNNINLLCAPSQPNIPQAELNIRTIKIQVRSLFHNLPFCAFPKTILKYLVAQTTSTINYFLVQHRLSNYYSPRMTVQKQLQDYDMHHKHNTGEYISLHMTTNRSKLI